MSGAGNPHVVCICLTADRQKQTDRALKCYREQTYKNRRLLIVDSGEEPYNFTREPGEYIWRTFRGLQTIGAMRNAAMAFAGHGNIWRGAPDALAATWDSDDWRHPASLEELVRRLIESGRECVGYHDALFWDSANEAAYRWRSNLGPDFILGGSMVFWREVWERQPFPDVNVGEDGKWLKSVRTLAIPGIFGNAQMIAERHAGNTSKIDMGYQCEHAPDAWKRVPEWDEYCKERM